MKTRKILPLLVVVAVALFSLSSCDQMLEGIYNLNNNSITITVAVDSAYSYLPVCITLDGATQSPMTYYFSSPDYYRNGYAWYKFNFTELIDDTYTWEVWIDGNWNYSYDSGYTFEDNHYSNGITTFTSSSTSTYSYSTYLP